MARRRTVVQPNQRATARQANSRPASSKSERQSHKLQTLENYQRGLPVLHGPIARTLCSTRRGGLAIMESGFVFITNRHKIIHGLLAYNRDSIQTSRPRGSDDQIFAIGRGHPLGWNASICMTDFCHASNYRLKTQGSLADFIISSTMPCGSERCLVLIVPSRQQRTNTAGKCGIQSAE